MKDLFLYKFFFFKFSSVNWVENRKIELKSIMINHTIYSVAHNFLWIQKTVKKISNTKQKLAKTVSVEESRPSQSNNFSWLFCAIERETITEPNGWFTAHSHLLAPSLGCLSLVWKSQIHYRNESAWLGSVSLVNSHCDEITAINTLMLQWKGKWHAKRKKNNNNLILKKMHR